MQLTQYFFQNSISLLQCVIIPEANYPKPLRFKTGGSFGIAVRLLEMLPTIQFHYDFPFKADEIHDVGWNRMLPPKLESAEITVFQVQPKPQFRVG